MLEPTAMSPHLGRFSALGVVCVVLLVAFVTLGAQQGRGGAPAGQAGQPARSGPGARPRRRAYHDSRGARDRRQGRRRRQRRRHRPGHEDRQRRAGDRRRDLHLRSRLRDGAAGHDRRARASELDLRIGRQVRQREPRHRRVPDRRRTRERAEDADGRLHDDPVAGRRQRRPAARRDQSRRGRRAAHPDVGHADSAGTAHARSAARAGPPGARRRART